MGRRMGNQEKETTMIVKHLHLGGGGGGEGGGGGVTVHYMTESHDIT